jgi:hypothetical protein
MFLKCSVRKKDGKEHRSWSIVESRRIDRTRTVHRPVPYLGRSREGTDWAAVRRILTIYRLLAPGSQWHLHREGFERTARADLLDVDIRAVQDDTL